jgi:diguanylate cyclase (GGDEF)-like protein
VNDLHGHATGDALLQKVAAILMEELPPGACCARLGGDEFAMLVTGDHAAREAAERIGAAIVGRLGEPLDVQGKLANISCSLGIAKTSSSSATIADLLRHADIAMYEAKRQGRNRFVWFTEAMAEELNQRNQLEAEMRAGIGRGEFVPYFQPQIQLDTGAVHGFEVLARWQHPERGIIEPNEFIGIAEATGLIANLSLAVMRTALESAKSWDHDLTIAINISPVQLKDPLLGQKVTKLLTETGFPAQRLELEITESSLFDDLDMALTTVESLKNLGIKISLDDFGTGYSSLTQLQSLPFDRIKIDRSFVISMKDNVESAAIVKAIVQLGASLQMPVTAEGVETLNIQNALQKLGCSEGQGWLFGKPISLEVLEASFGRPATRAPRAVGTASSDHEAPQFHERRDFRRRGAKAASS